MLRIARGKHTPLCLKRSFWRHVDVSEVEVARVVLTCRAVSRGTLPQANRELAKRAFADCCSFDLVGLHMMGCQNYCPFLGTNTRCRITMGTQKRDNHFDNHPSCFGGGYIYQLSRIDF